MENTVIGFMGAWVFIYMWIILIVGGLHLLIFLWKLLFIREKNKAFKNSMLKYFCMVFIFFSIPLSINMIHELFPKNWTSILVQDDFMEGISLVYILFGPIPIALYFFKNILLK